ncbi:MAG: hypothetical protein D6699_05835 [Aquificota bacterium]|nr:MAG: hypothetical protein D6699_05835 [Aquificota bacterium]
MSVRHQTRQLVEELFEGLRERVQEGEYTVYRVYAPTGAQDVEDYELSEQRVDLAQQESVKAFLDRSTREALENQVRGIELVAFVLDMQGEYVFSTRRELPKEGLIERIERLKEE